MKRKVELFDPGEHALQAQPVGIDLFAICNKSSDGSEAAGDADRLRVGVRRQRLVDEFRIERVGLAVEVEGGAGKTRANQRSAELRDRLEQKIDEAIL